MLTGYILFHLNLAFSSIEEAARPRVVARCYHPLLDLADRHGLPIAVEASGYTLEAIQRIDPAWLARLRALIAAGRVEFVGSGYTQLIGPLVPAEVVAMNLRLGLKCYRSLLGLAPSLALVNEQAYSAGLVPHYAEAGFRGLITDYDNCAHYHPEWPAEVRYAPQRVAGSDGAVLDLLWTHTIAFQKVQRLAHGDITLAEYRRFVRGQAGSDPRLIALYSNDAEVFDFRPGRLHTEAPLGRADEWLRVADALMRLRAEDGVRLDLPTALIEQWPATRPAPLRLESAACPIPVKKQHKYNVTRWAVTGRDDLDINTRCHRLYEAIAGSAEDEAWQTLCALWASDFRTHITPARWQRYQERLAAAERAFLPACAPRVQRAGTSGPHPGSNQARVAREGRFLEIETPALRVRLNSAKGLAIDGVWFAGEDPTGPALCGTLHHGEMADLSYSPDWFTGSTVFDRPGEPKITDLGACEPRLVTAPDGSVTVDALIATPLGPIRKVLHLGGESPEITFDLLLDWSHWPRGSLRLANLILLPGAFEPSDLSLRTHNGGRTPETFALAGTSFDHGQPVSMQVSAATALGMTEGWLDIGDRRRRVALSVDKSTAALVALVTHRPARGQVFCRVELSALEFDETRKPEPASARPRRFRFSLRPGALDRVPGPRKAARAA